MTVKKTLTNLPADLAQVALIDAATAAAVGGMSVSWWLAQVQAGSAPKPVVRGTRCTRWLSVAVVAFWRSVAQDGPKDLGKAERLTARSRKASQASVAARTAGPSGGKATKQALTRQVSNVVQEVL